MTISSGLSNPTGLLLSGNTLYAGNIGNGTVTEYNATTGAQGITISTGSQPVDMAISGNNLYVANAVSNTVTEYNATSGGSALLTISSNISNPQAIFLSGGNIFVANGNNNTITEENATTGALVNTFSSGVNHPFSLIPAPEPNTAALMIVASGLLVFTRFSRRRGCRRPA